MSSSEQPPHAAFPDLAAQAEAAADAARAEVYRRHRELIDAHVAELVEDIRAVRVRAESAVDLLEAVDAKVPPDVALLAGSRAVETAGLFRPTIVPPGEAEASVALDGDTVVVDAEPETARPDAAPEEEEEAPAPPPPSPPADLSASQRRVLATLADGPLALRAIWPQVGLRQPATSRILRQLEERGLVQRVGGGSNAQWARPDWQETTKAPPPNADGMAWVLEHAPTSAVALAGAFDADVGWAGRVLSILMRAGHIFRTDSGEWALSEDGIREAEARGFREAEAAEEAAPEAAVRDWVVSQQPGDAFMPSEAAADLKTTTDAVLPALDALTRRGVVTNESPSDDMLLFSYAGKPDAPGKAAEHDQQRAKDSAAEGASVGGAPVAGTGKKTAISHQGMRQLVHDLERAGATVGVGASGHFSVKKKGCKPSTIPGSPGSDRAVLSARARMRREGFFS